MAEVPEKDSLWEVIHGSGKGKLITVVDVIENDDPRATFPIVVIRPMDSQETARVPLDYRWGTGVIPCHVCPECKQPIPGPHLGTCRYSLMRTGGPLMHTRPEQQKLQTVIEGSSSIADQIRSLVSPVALYRLAGETDETMLSVARELEADMMYTGMSDTLIEIAAEVEKLEEAARG